MRNVFIFLFCCLSTACGSNRSANDNPLGTFKHYTEYPKDDPETVRKGQEIGLVILKESLDSSEKRINSECE